jgi:pyocin large subunit-like protein
MNPNRTALAGACVAVLAALSACDNGPSAVGTRDRSDGGLTTAAYDGGSGGENRTYVSTRDRSDRNSFRRDRGAGDDSSGWAANRKHSGAENAEYHFKRDGADFGARTVDDYVHKAKTFVGRPPKGTLTLERSNGDTLFYDPKANTFAVASKDGAPRTMFKPKEGMAYWDEQKAREAKRRDRAEGDDERG